MSRYGKSRKLQIDMTHSSVPNWKQTSKCMMYFWLGRKSTWQGKLPLWVPALNISPLGEPAMGASFCHHLCGVFSLVAIKMALLLMYRRIESLSIGFYPVISHKRNAIFNFLEYLVTLGCWLYDLTWNGLFRILKSMRWLCCWQKNFQPFWPNSDHKDYS